MVPPTPDQQAQVGALPATKASTLRVVAEGLEKHLYTPFPVLDHGFVRVVDYMGDDSAVVQAARVRVRLETHAGRSAAWHRRRSARPST